MIRLTNILNEKFTKGEVYAGYLKIGGKKVDVEVVLMGADNIKRAFIVKVLHIDKQYYSKLPKDGILHIPARLFRAPGGGWRRVKTPKVFEDLRKWFGKGKTGSTTGGGWDRYSTTGKKMGKCGDAEEGEPYSACLSQEKAKKLGTKGIASFVRRKRDAQKKAGDKSKGGESKKGQKPVMVKTGA